MIIPSNRLIAWAAVLLPFLAVAALVPRAAGISYLLLAGFLFIALMDASAVLAGSRRISVSIPEVTRLSKDKEGLIRLAIRNESMKELSLWVGLPLPSDIRSEHDVLNVMISGGSLDHTATYPCIPSKRGSFPIDACYFELPSPLGFWNARGRTACSSVIRVYPNLASERKRLASIFLNRGNFGIHTHRMIGQGRDFEKLRDYMPGDSYDEIHWKATAKRGRPVTKLFQVERTQEIYVAIDSSRLSARESGPEPVLEFFMKSALTLGLVAERQSDLFGLVVFSDKIRRFVRASAGKAHYIACRDALYTLNSDLVSPDYEEFSAFVRHKLRRRALLMVLTDLSDPMIAEGFMKSADLIRSRHLVIVSMIKPAGIGPLFAGPDADSTDSLYTKLGCHMIWRNIMETEKALGHRGIGFSMPDSSELSAGLVSQYMKVKARQIL